MNNAVRTALALSQLDVPGVQIQSPQRPVAAVQLVPEGHVVVDV